MIFLNKRLIGKTDKADLPDWALKKIPVKIDSGAFRSSIDCSFTKVVKRNGIRILQFILLNEGHPLFTGKVFETEHFITSKIKSSNGENQKRYIVTSKITLFATTIETDFSLSSRTDMKFPILLGRKLLNKNFIIDTSKSNLSHKLKKRQKKSIEF